MIRINTARIPAEGEHLEGEEDSALLELESIPGIPVFSRTPIHYDLHAVMVGRDLLVTGSAFVEFETECVTCLAKMKVKVGDPEICIHMEKVPEEEVDLTPEIREDILLAMPARFKCSEECKGLCPGCGVNLNTEKCRCGTKRKKGKQPPENDAWSALDGLKL